MIIIPQQTLKNFVLGNQLRYLFVIFLICFVGYTSSYSYKNYPRNYTDDGSENYFILSHDYYTNPLKYSFAPKPVSDVEIEASIDDFLKLPHPTSLRPLLCTTFTTGGKRSFNILLSRMLSIDGECDWAVLVFRFNATTIEHEVKTFTEAAKEVNLNVVLVDYSGHSGRVDVLHKYAIFDGAIKPDRTKDLIEELIDEHRYNSHSLPKPILLSNLIPISSKYEYVWVMDDDIWPIDVKIGRLLSIVKNAFTNPLYVAQPLLYENYGRYPYLKWEEWSYKRDIIAQETGFIEFQMPLYNGLFLEFYLRNIIARYLWPSHVTGVDFGLDNTFCPVAELFAMKHTAISKGINKPSNVVACGAITEIFVRRIILKSSSSDTDFENLRASISSSIALFSSVRVTGLSFAANPFKNSELKSVTKLTK